MTFDEQVMQTIKNSILQQLSKEVVVKVDYQQRQSIPKEFIEKVWADVDWSAVIAQIKPEIQNRICRDNKARIYSQTLRAVINSVMDTRRAANAPRELGTLLQCHG